jgi:DNA-directed RNA polymerase subunit N
MLIPVRCQSCGKPIGHLEHVFEKERIANPNISMKELMDKYGLKLLCCRYTMMTYVDIVKLQLAYDEANEVQPRHSDTQSGITTEYTKDGVPQKVRRLLAR